MLLLLLGVLLLAVVSLGLVFLLLLGVLLLAVVSLGLVLLLLLGVLLLAVFNDLCGFRGSLVFYTKRLFQTAHGKMAESRMADKDRDV